MRLAGAIGAVRLAVRGFVVRSWVRGLWVRRSWVCHSWVCCSWVMGSLFVGSWVRHSWVRCSWVRWSPVDDLVGGATISTFWVRDLSLSVCAWVLSLSLFLSLRVSGNDLKWKFGLKIISVGFGLFYGQTENIFSLTQFSIPTKHAIFRKMISEFHFQSKQTDPKCTYFSKHTDFSTKCIDIHTKYIDLQ